MSMAVEVVVGLEEEGEEADAGAGGACAGAASGVRRLGIKKPCGHTLRLCCDVV